MENCLSYVKRSLLYGKLSHVRLTLTELTEIRSVGDNVIDKNVCEIKRVKVRLILTLRNSF